MGETGKKGSGKENPKVQLGHVTFETAAGGGGASRTQMRV